MKLKYNDDDDSAQSMSAMTDVVFLLLIFFLVTMSGYVETTLLEAGLPPAGTAGNAVELTDAIRITVQAPELAGEAIFLVDANAMNRTELTALLRRYGRLQPEVEILIGSTPEARHRDLVFVLSACAQNGLKHLKLLKVAAPEAM